jgi:putative restriction endonuclease
MAHTRKDRIARLAQGLEEGGSTVVIGYRPRLQPMPMTIDGERYRIFSWRISHGGKRRPKDEYRVQTTRSGDIPFWDPDQPTLLLGWYDPLDVFAVWDVRMHRNPRSSDSLQVRLPMLREAAEEGFVTRERSVEAGIELVAAFRPEAMPTYLQVAGLLSGPGATKKDCDAAMRAGNGEEVPVAELPRGVARRSEIRMIEEKVRDQRFRSRVIDAYRRSCAFCGLGGGLVQAAHIEGVGEGGPDLVVNGLAVCPNHHLSFDRGLITVDANRRIEVDAERLRRSGCSLRQVRAFRAGLLDRLALPRAAANHPGPERLAAHRERWR